PALMAPLGVDEGSVRTAVHRLVADGWLNSVQVGRRRNLRMPAERLAVTRPVQARIYNERPESWNGAWFLVLISPATASSREALRRALSAEGFASLSPNMFVHPHYRWRHFQTYIEERGFRGDIAAAFEASEVSGGASMAELWDLDAIAAEWEDIERLSEIADRADRGADAFAARTLLIHAMRRLVLKTPSLPQELLPNAWPELRVRRKLKAVYLKLWKKSDAWAGERTISADGGSLRLDAAEPDRFEANLFASTPRQRGAA
ncbi:MAG: PaaX family transcriptional regulator C-terminal domain-containing protein, partial [Pseudomonadota bacterium]